MINLFKKNATVEEKFDASVEKLNRYVATTKVLDTKVVEKLEAEISAAAEAVQEERNRKELREKILKTCLEEKKGAKANS